MVLYVIGDTVTLAAGGTDTITLKPDVDVQIKEIGISSTGRVEINRIEIIGVRTILKGKVEADTLTQQQKRWILEEPVPWAKGQELAFGLLDISGASNKVYIACYCTSR